MEVCHDIISSYLSLCYSISPKGLPFSVVKQLRFFPPLALTIVTDSAVLGISFHAESFFMIGYSEIWVVLFCFS